jgi:hypothetical protein
MSDGFGKPRYGNNTSLNYKTFDIKTDKSGGTVSYVFRILPPIKKCAETGEWAKYHSIHFGYGGVDQKDPTKTKQRPFKCVEQLNWKTKMVIHECPECNLINQKKTELEELLTELKTNPSNTDDIIENATKDLKDWIRAHNLDRKWYINVMNTSGELGVLRMSHEMKKLLELKIQKLVKEESIDPLDPDQGVYFRFTRTGYRLEAQSEIEPETESVRDSATGRTMRSVKLAPLTEAQKSQILQTCPDLNDVVRIISDRQIELLTQCSGDPESVDEILSMGQREASPREASPRPKPTPVVTKSVVPVAPKAVVAEAPVVEAAQPPTSPDPLAALRAMGLSEEQIKAIASMASAAPKTPEVVVQTKAEAVPVTEPPINTPVALPKDKFMSLFKKP